MLGTLHLQERRHQERGWEEALLPTQAGSYYSTRPANSHVRGEVEMQTHSPLSSEPCFPVSCPEFLNKRKKRRERERE